MTIRFIGIFFFSFLFLVSNAQNSFEDSELEEFVSIYMEFKIKKKRPTLLDSTLLQKYTISTARYRVISKQLLLKEKTQLKPNEIAFIKEIENQNKKVKDQQAEIIQSLCLEHGLSFDKYMSILHQYNTDLPFQRSLKPYFADYLNALK
ncbi:MAG: hypothetical protein P1U56_11485 [Saprospiraceae bacterium]|nr:hypothetical protein [Saprospiraceae bacterium]